MLFHPKLIRMTRNEGSSICCWQRAHGSHTCFCTTPRKESWFSRNADRMTEKELASLQKMYSAWLSLEGPYLCDTVAQEDQADHRGSAENLERPDGPVYTTTAIFSFPAPR